MIFVYSTDDDDIKLIYSLTVTFYVYILIRPQPGECGSVINTGGVFTLQKSLRCDCPRDHYGFSVLTVDGHGTVLKLNGYTVECKPATVGGSSSIIKVVGTANTVMGPGTREYIQ